jgi:hypothetical protein
MICLPIFTTEDPLNVGKESLATYPRAILHIINKKQEEDGPDIDSLDEVVKAAYFRSQKFTTKDTECI